MSYRLVWSLLYFLPLLSFSVESILADSAKEETSFDWSAVETQPEQAEHILKAVLSWRGQEEKNGGKKLRVVYFYPKDRQPLKDHAKRWDGIMSDIQDFYRTK